eukprot:GHVL01008363.1.p1 GENE.GHVL01008363.1~~GHVL01008363.1.p1  ORF type:complete len:238 (+),score=-3.50 GHVL01008363.1:94-807(+)
MNFLRNNLTDYNSANRSGEEWIYDDWPKASLSEKSFPRVSVRKLTEDGRIIGLGDTDTWDGVSIQFDVLIHRKTGVVTVTHTDEAVGAIANSPRISFDYAAASVTNIKHGGSAFGTVTMVVNDNDFTTPASLSAGTVEWSLSSGNLNFSSSDLTSYSGAAITSTYAEKLEGERLAKRVGRDVVNAIQDYWRTDALFDNLHDPEKISGPSVIEFGIPEQWHRVMVEYGFKRYNTGREV